jgi:hypothetical protein
LKFNKFINFIYIFYIYYSAKKFDCEDWLLTNSEARIYNLFDGKHGYNQNYPRYLYDGSIPTSFDLRNSILNCTFKQEYK